MSTHNRSAHAYRTFLALYRCHHCSRDIEKEKKNGEQFSVSANLQIHGLKKMSEDDAMEGGQKRKRLHSQAGGLDDDDNDGESSAGSGRKR